MNTETNMNGNAERLLAPVLLLGKADWDCNVPGCQLRHEAKHNREQERQNGDANGNPRSDGVWPAKSSGQLVLTEQAVSATLEVIPTGNPLAQLLGCLLAKFVGIRRVFHGTSAKRPNDQTERRLPAATVEMQPDQRKTNE